MSKDRIIQTLGESELLLPDLLTDAAGLLTADGGRTSHAAVVARELGKPCVVGASDPDIDLRARRVTIGGHEFAEGEEISIDGSTGRVFAGAVTLQEECPTADLAAVSSWQTA